MTGTAVCRGCGQSVALVEAVHVEVRSSEPNGPRTYFAAHAQCAAAIPRIADLCALCGSPVRPEDVARIERLGADGLYWLNTHLRCAPRAALPGETIVLPRAKPERPS
jgi:hypothetical protein